MDYIYRSIFSQLYRSEVAHWCIPNHNLISLERVDENDASDTKYSVLDENLNDFSFIRDSPVHKDFNFDVSKSSVFFCGSGKRDIVKDDLLKKIRWETKLSEYKLDPRKTVTMLSDYESEKRRKIPFEVIDYLKHFESDPEPNFSGLYNWMYTRGNLSKVFVDGSLFLIGANKSTLNLLKVDSFVKDHKEIVMKIKQPILQIVSSNEKVGVLQRNNVTIGRVTAEGNWDVLTKKKNQFPAFLTSVDICGEFFGICDTGYQICIYDLNTRKVVTKSKVRSGGKTKDKWSQILFDNHNLLNYANRDYIFLYDRRVSMYTPSCKFKPSINPCDDISLIFSDGEKNLYVGMHHSLTKIDFRYQKNKMQWTHLLKGSPCFGKHVKIDKDDLIILGNQNREIVAITDDSKIGSLPFLLNSIEDTISNIQLSGKLLSPSIKYYSKFSFSGMELVNNVTENRVFVQNSRGDIFIMDVNKKDNMSFNVCDFQFNKAKIRDMFVNYEMSCNRTIKRQKVYVTDVKDMQHLFDVVKQPSQSGCPKRREATWKYDEMMAPSSLKLYKDVIAQKTLSVWSLSSLESDDELEEERHDDIDKTQKVQEWLSLQDEDMIT